MLITAPGCFNFNTSNQPCKTSADCNHEMTCIEGICVATYMMNDGGGGSGISISDITPASPYVTVGKTKQFSATVSGATDLTVDWSASCGTINATGLFTAPASASQCEIKATSHADPNAFKKTTAKVVAAPVITSFTAAKSPVSNGKGTTLTSVFENGTGTIDNGIGPVTSGTAIPTGNLSVTMTYKLTVTNQAGDFETSEVTIQVIAAPSITSFTASPDKLTKGNKTNLTAVFENGTGEVDHGIGAVTSNAAVLSPAINEDTTFKLTVTNAAGDSVDKDAYVQAVEAPSITSFNADPNPALYGGKTSLTAVFSGGTGSIDNGIGPVTSGIPVETANLTVATKYKLTVTNTLGQSDTREVTVNIQDVSVSDITPAGQSMSASGKLQFSAAVTGALDTVVNWEASAGSIDATGYFTAPSTAQTVTITARSRAKTTVYKQTTVNVVTAPQITSFTANPNPALYGGTTKLTAVFAGGTGEVDNGIGAVVSGTPVDTGALTVATKYKLTVTNGVGDSDTKEATVNIQAVTVSDITPANPYVTVSGTKQFSATVSGAYDTGIDWTATCGSIDATGKFTAPSSPQSCEVTATSHAKPGVLKKTGVTLVNGPHITSFTAAKSTITSGNGTTLTGVFEDGTGYVDKTVGTVTSGVAVAISPTVTTKYTLTVTNLAGDATTAEATVKVVAAPAITSFTASPDKVTKGEKTNLTAVFGNGSGAVDQGVGPVTSGTAVQSPVINTDVTFRLTVTNEAGDYVTKDAFVQAYDSPVISSFTADPNPALYGGKTSLTAVFSGGTGTIDNGIGTVTSGTPVDTGNLTVATKYKLTVANTLGQSDTKEVTVGIQDVVVSDISPASPSITANKSIQFAATVSGALNTGVQWEASAGSITSAGFFTAPSTAQAVTITAKSQAKITVYKQTTVNVVAAPTITSFSANPTTALYGGTSKLTAVFGNGTGEIDNGIGTVTSNVGVNTAAIFSQTIYKLTVTNGLGDSITDTATVNVSTVSVDDVTPANPYVTVVHQKQFSSGVNGAYDTTIDWSSTCGSMDASGKFTSPAAPASCTVKAASHAKTDKYKQTGVTVVPEPHITSFTAAKSTITAGNSTTLTAVFEDGSGAVDKGVGAVTSNIAKTVSPSSTATYTLTVTNDAGDTTTAQATITVVAAPSITSFVANPDKVTKGEKTNLTAVFSNGSGVVDNGVGVVSSGVAVQSGVLSADTTFKLTVTNPAGDTVDKDVFVQAIDAPVISSFTADPNPALYDGTTNLTAVFSGGTGSIDNGIGTVTSGTPAATGKLTAQTTYKLTVTNTLGKTDTKDLTVNVQDVTISDVTPQNAYVTVNAQKQFSATVSGAADGSVLWSANVGTIDGNGLYTAPASATTATIIAKSKAKQSVFKQATVYVIAAPSITSFTANPNPVSYGGKSKLTGVFANGTGVVDNGVGGVISGTVVDTATLTAATTYKLTVTNLAGDHVDSTTTVNIQTVTITDISPANPNVTVGHTKQFNATVSGAADSTVDWSAGCGSINSSGLFTAPATPTSCEITATSHGKPDVFKKTNVTVVPEPHITSFTVAKSPITNGTSTTLTGVFEDGTGSVNQSVGAITSNTPKTISPTSTTTYTLTVTNPANDTTTAQVTVTVVPAPSITSFTASPDKVTIGDNKTSNLTAVYSNGTGEVDNGIGSVTSGVAKQTSAINATITYTLTVTNSANDTATRQVTITAYDPPAIQSFTASPDNPIPYNSTVTFSATFTGGTGSIDNSVGSITSGGTKTKSNMVSDTTFTLTVTNSASKTTTQSVNLYIQPRDVTGLAATPADSGAKLTWTDPPDADLDYIEITWNPGVGSTTIAKGLKVASITSLTNGTAYTFIVKAVDTTGYKSAGVSIGVTPAALQDVTNFTPEATDKVVWLTWTEPAGSTVYKGVHLYCMQGGTPCGDVKIPKSTTTVSFTGLTNELTYSFTAKSYDIIDNEKSPGVTASAMPLGCEGKPDFTLCHNKGAIYKYNICVDQVCVMPGCGDQTCNPPGPNFPLATMSGTHYLKDTSVNEQPVVHDSTTGLDWQGCTAGLQGENCETGNSTLFNNWAAAINYCNILNWGERQDWRLPDFHELISIIDFGLYNPAIDRAAFPSTPSNYFCSISSGAGGDFNAWGALLTYGNMGSYTSGYDSPRVRCVRGMGKGVAIRFSKLFPVQNDHPIVYDNITKLTWQGCPAGLSGATCNNGAAINKNWDNAQIYCTGLNWGGQSTGWRLPNVRELSSLVDTRRSYSAISPTFFPNTVPSVFWSSSPSWVVQYNLGYVSNYTSPSSLNYLRCVRDLDIPPPDVTNLTAQVSDQTVALTWTEPAANTGYKGIHIYCSQEGTPCGDVKINSGTTNYTFTGLTNDLLYTFTAKSFDERDNESSGAVVKAMPPGCPGQPDFKQCYIHGAAYKYNICVDQVCVMPGCGDATCNVPGPNFSLPPITGSHFTRDTSVSGQPLVNDTVTGLMWQGCAAGLSGNNCEGGSPTGKNWNDALAFCNTLSWGGYSDWRLPSPEELQTIVDYGKYNPAIDTAAFPATLSSNFWSSSSIANNASEAWHVFFNVGYMSSTGKTSTCNVRCVRGVVSTVSAPRFQKTFPVADQPLVYDSVTYLTWQGCPAGLWGDNCQNGGLLTKNWTDAGSYCTGLNWGGYTSGWRLPNVMELESILNRRRYDPTVDTTAFHVTPSDYFWSSSFSNDACDAWSVNFFIGYVALYVTSTSNVRCVR